MRTTHHLSPTREILVPILEAMMAKDGRIKFKYPIADAAWYLGISKTHCQTLVNQGRLPSVTDETDDTDGPRTVTLGHIIEYVCGREIQARRKEA
jgi:hypothetical protein